MKIIFVLLLLCVTLNANKFHETIGYVETFINSTETIVSKDGVVEYEIEFLKVDFVKVKEIHKETNVTQTVFFNLNEIDSVYLGDFYLFETTDKELKAFGLYLKTKEGYSIKTQWDGNASQKWNMYPIFVSNHKSDIVLLVQKFYNLFEFKPK